MPDRYTFLDLDIDLGKRLVQRARCTLEVTGLTFDLLACLIVRGGAVVSFDELMAAVWAPAVVNDETVTQRIKLLRQALGDDSRKPRYIRSVRGRGYQLMAEPRAVTGSSDAACAPADFVQMPLGVRGTRNTFLLSAGVAVALIGTAILLVLAHRLGQRPVQISSRAHVITHRLDKGTTTSELSAFTSRLCGRSQCRRPPHSV